jgi:hypothetical protein
MRVPSAFHAIRSFSVPRPESLGAERRRAEGGTEDVFRPLDGTGEQVHAASGGGLLQNLRIGRGEVGGRNHLEPLPHGEGDKLLVMPVDAGNVADQFEQPPPAGLEGVAVHAEGPGRPVVRCQPRVVRPRIGAGQGLVQRQSAPRPGWLAK